jgi:twitching motility protein PilJ
MTLKLPAFKLPSMGAKKPALAMGDTTTGLVTRADPGPATIDPHGDSGGARASRASVRLPWLSGKPFKTQIQLLGGVLALTLLVAIALVALDTRSATNLAAQVEITGDSLMHSQRVAKAVPTAVQGNPEAFKQLKDSRDRLKVNLDVLINGGAYNGRDVAASGDAIQPTLGKILEEWKRTEKNATIVLEQEKILTSFGSTLQKINAQNPLLLELTEQISALKLQTGAPAREISAAGQLVMLTQRLAKNANELLVGEGVNPETAFLLGKDTNTFRDLLDGLINGSDALRLAPARDPETVEKLNELKKSFDEFQKSVSTILSNLQRIVSAKQAEQLVFKENESLRASLASLQDLFNQELNKRTGTFTVLGLLVVVALLAAAGIAYVFYQDSELRAQESERQRQTAQRQEEEAKHINDANQAAILRLMNELQEVADGDLTVQATVSEDITGAIADSVNYTVEELRGLVARVTAASEQVAQASSQAEQTSSRLLAAATEQSREIQETGESVLSLASQINEVSHGAMESANVARQSLAAAEEGQVAVQNAISGMNEIREQIQETSKRIKRLGESSQEIGEIIELISDITEQTNVLALNAAIQAASAGEAGRGFTVVAEEVQRLAERSAEATKQIGALVRTIQTDTQDAVGAMEKSTQGVVEGAKLSDNAGQALSNIGRVSRQLAELIENISQTTSKQADSANSVAKSIQHILAVNEETTTGTQQTASSIRQLAGLAHELKNSVARFRVS